MNNFKCGFCDCTDYKIVDGENSSHEFLTCAKCNATIGVINTLICEKELYDIEKKICKLSENQVGINENIKKIMYSLNCIIENNISRISGKENESIDKKNDKDDDFNEFEPIKIKK